METSAIQSGPFRSFGFATPGTFDGKQDLLVELDLTVPNGVKLLVTPGNEIGTVHNSLQPGAKSVTINRLGGADGTKRVIQSGAINRGTRVVADGANLGKVKAIPGATGTYRTIGRKLQGDNAGSANEVIEIDGVIEWITVA